ncbi:MAG: DUF1810 family protein [Chloracidobacterium sp.]|nr:DUF1810 family protein [Chloracidobacterium sp.]
MDIFQLQRFLNAQEQSFGRVIDELSSGAKRTHWMWFVFPQVEGLGRSETARTFAIKSLKEAVEYLKHPVLGLRLRECARIVYELEGRSVSDIFGYPDDLKFHSSMTLFAQLDGSNSIFQSVLNKYFDGKVDKSTISILRQFGLKTSSVNNVPDLPESAGFMVFAKRVTKSGKEKCGDSFVVEVLEQENMLVLAVADGVSSSPCDWKASETACEAVLEKFKKSSGSVALRMTTAAEKAHSSVRQIDGKCSGSITSLTFVVWDTTESQINVLNVGDSRVYIGPDTGLEPVTRDDVLPVVLKRNGEVVLQAGVPVFMRGVTRSLGQMESLEFLVETHPFRSSDILLLVSDGVTKNEAFTSKIPSIFSSSDIERGLSNLVIENSQRNKDDATLIAVWSTASDASNVMVYERCLQSKSDFREAGLLPNQIVEFIRNDLLSKIANDQNDAVNEVLDYAERFGIRFDRSFLSEFLSQVIKQGTDKVLVARLREFIRRAN